MTKKINYYTPKLEEFHVGFRFEYYMERLDRHVTSILNTDSINGVFTSLSLGEIRVKHLDRKDIESNGWIQNKERQLVNIQVFTKTFQGIEHTLLFHEDELNVTFLNESVLIGSATAKNINEFQRLERQIIR